LTNKLSIILSKIFRHIAYLRCRNQPKKRKGENDMMISTLKRMTLLLLLAGPLTFLTGCNTMEGLGQDTQELGESIEESADKHKN